MSHEAIGALLGRAEAAIRNRCWRLRIRTKAEPWSDADLDAVREAFAPGRVSNAAALAERLGRTVDAVHLMSSRMGLGDYRRKKVEVPKIRKPMFATKEELTAHKSASQKKRLAENGHPRGALGMKHTAENKDKQSKRSKEWFASLSVDQRTDLAAKMMRSRIANGTYAPPRQGTTWKAAWREIGGVRKFYRSKWEANYARYLQWLKDAGQIADWKHEPKTFWFEGVKRGTMSYLPDFWVCEVSGAEAYHEVKGWMDERSATKIKRMAKYHPDVTLIVIREKDYKEIKRKLSSLIPEWEA